MTAPAQAYGYAHRGSVVGPSELDGYWMVRCSAINPARPVGPYASTVPDLAVDDRVLLTQIGTSRDDLVITGKLPPAPWGSHLPIDIADVSGLQAALDLKAALASPTFTGVPAAPTAAPGTNTTQLANTAFVAAAITALIGTAPGVLDTLGEISDAINDDANLYTTLVAALNAKVADAINDGTTTVAPSQNAVFDALALKAPLRVTIPADKTDNYTATAVDANSSTGINVATAKNVTINTGVFTAGDLMEYRQVGAGQVTIAAGGGVTFRAPAGAKTRVQYSAVQVLALGGEVFSVSGDVTA